MSNLLIHSMAEFSDIIVEALDLAGAREIVEIGAEFGGMSALLADYAAAHEGRLTSVDPCPKEEFADWAAEHPEVRHLAKTSFEAFEELANVDAWVIDGDHNWSTVFHESQAIWERCKASGTPFLAFYHDVGWPWARRDLYYAPDSLPPEHRQPFTFAHGVTLDNPGVIAGGFRGEGGWACARREGGPRNGVLTAIEDFMEGRDGLRLVTIPSFFGLGVLWHLDAPWSDAVAAILDPWDRSPLLQRLEENRIFQIAQAFAATSRLESREAMLRRIEGSSAFAVAERLSRLRVRLGIASEASALSREEIRRVLSDGDRR